MPRKKYSETREARRFSWILALILAALAGLSWWRAHPQRAALLVAASLVVALLPLVAFPVWMRVFRLWMKFALVLNWVMTRVILSVFFYAVLTPVGRIMHLLGKAPLDLAWKDGKTTYWIDKPTGEATIARYEKNY
jgi:O-antigen/teichoic acid export membrane protein